MNMGMERTARLVTDIIPRMIRIQRRCLYGCCFDVCIVGSLCCVCLIVDCLLCSVPVCCVVRQVVQGVCVCLLCGMREDGVETDREKRLPKSRRMVGI